jgi:hypothetical protein
MDREMIIGLIQYKAQAGGKFTEAEAAHDLALNELNLGQRALAKRWGWSQSMVSRLWKILVLARESIESTVNQNESNLWETEPKTHTLNQNESKQAVSGKKTPKNTKKVSTALGNGS